MRDVAAVVLNRVHHPIWWGDDVLSVCHAPWQFSCWNAGQDYNHRAMLAVDETNALFVLALQVADEALAGKLVDMTGGADSYFAVTIEPPAWAHPPSIHTTTRWLHSFWRTTLLRARTAPPGPGTGPANASAHGAGLKADGDPPPDSLADALNEAELARLGGGA
jgi:hypothetical protein